MSSRVGSRAAPASRATHTTTEIPEKTQIPQIKSLVVAHLNQQIAAFSTPNNNEKIELETRFHDIDIRVYNRVLDFLKDTPAVTTETTVATSDRTNDGVVYRKITSYDANAETVMYEKKILQSVLKVLPYNYNIAKSIEQTISEPKVVYTMERHRVRKTFSFTNYQIDVTEISTTFRDVYKPNTYEIEIEYKTGDISAYYDAIMKIYLAIHDTRLSYTVPMKNRIINDLLAYLNTSPSKPNKIPKGVVPTTRNLKMNDLVYGGIVGNHFTDYSVTYKPDGVRKLLVILPMGIFFVMAPNEVNFLLAFTPELLQKHPDLRQLFGTILDGEYIPPGTKYRKANIDGKGTVISEIYWYITFDCLMRPKQIASTNDPIAQLEDFESDGKTVRSSEIIRPVIGEFNKQKFEYEDVRDYPEHSFRRNWAQQVTATLNRLRLEELSFRLTNKDYSVLSIDNFYDTMRSMITRMNMQDYKVDGLVFTPIHTKYQIEIKETDLNTTSLVKTPAICKWKPVDQLTIDFRLNWRAVAPNGRQPRFYSSGHNYVIFEGTATNGFNPRQYEPVYSDPKTGKENWYPEGTIVKFSRTVRGRGTNSVLLARQVDTLDVVLRKWDELIPDRPFTDNIAVRLHYTSLEPRDWVYEILKMAEVEFVGDTRFPFDGVVVDDSLDRMQSYRSGTIVEMGWTSKGMRFFRTRDDKESPNKLVYALDNWNAIQNPITLETLQGISLDLLFAYHRRLKTQLFETAGITEESVVLDIGTGIGGDISRYERYRPKKIIAVEPNAENRKKFVERLSTSTIRDRVTLLDVGGEATTPILAGLGGERANVIMSMFSMTFFWLSQSNLKAFARTLSESLTVGGRFVFITMDGDAVQQFFEPPLGDVILPHRRLINNGAGELLYMKDKLRITLPGSRTVVAPQEEGLVHLRDLIALLEPHGFVLREAIRTLDEPLLNVGETEMSRLYTRGYFERVAENFDMEKIDPYAPDALGRLEAEMSRPAVPTPLLNLPSLPTVSTSTFGLVSDEDLLPSTDGKDLGAEIKSSQQTPQIPGQITTMNDEEAEAIRRSLDTHRLEQKRLVGLPSLKDDQVEIIAAPSISGTIVRIGAIGDGTCLIHAILKAGYAPYQVASESQRRAMGRQFRDELAIKISESYDTISGGALAIFERDAVAGLKPGEQRVTNDVGEPINLSKESLIDLFRSNRFLGNETWGIISDVANVSIIVMMAIAGNLTYIGEAVADPNGPFIVVSGNGYHFETLAVQTPAGLQTIFRQTDPFIRDARPKRGQ